MPRRVAAADRIVGPQRRTRLDGDRGAARDIEFHPDDPVGLGERALGRGAIAEHGIHEHVVLRFVPDRGRPGGDRILGMRHPRQLLVLHRHAIGCVRRPLARLRDHHRDRLPDVARLVGGQEPVRALEDRAAARRGELHVLARRGQGMVRYGLQAVGRAVGPGIDAEHSGHGPRARRIDAHNACVRMRGAHHRGVRLPGEVEVVGEAPGPGKKALVLLAQYGPADVAHRPRCVRKKAIDSASARSASGLL